MGLGRDGSRYTNEPHVISGVTICERTVEVDTISEVTSAHGVTIDSVNVKDGTITSLAGNDCIAVRVDKDGDGDYDPYTSTSWDGDSHSNAESGTINWTSVFGVPSGAKMVYVFVLIRDETASFGSGILGLKAKSTTTNFSFTAYSGQGVDTWGSSHGWVPVAADGTSYYYIGASGAGHCDITMTVPAYAK